MYKKYNPNDFKGTIKEQMEKIYQTAESNDTTILECLVADMHLFLKQEAVMRNLEPNVVKEMQDYFWGLLK